MIRLLICVLGTLPLSAQISNWHGLKVSKVQAADVGTVKQNVQFETWVEQLPRDHYEGVYATFAGVEESGGKATIRRLARDHFRKIQVSYQVMLQADAHGTRVSFDTFVPPESGPNAVPKGYAAQSPEALPVPQLVRDGDVIKIVLHTRSLGTKMVEYIRVGSPAVAEILEEAPRDSYADDAEFNVTQPAFRANGRGVKAQSIADLHGASLRVSIPGFGSYVLSLKQHPELRYENVGEVYGKTLTFMVRGNLFRIDCADQIAPGSAVYNVYGAPVSGGDDPQDSGAIIRVEPVLGVSLTGSALR